MPKFAADLDTLFSGLPFLDRFAAAAAAGYRGVECRSPYAWPVEQIAHRLCLYGLELVQHALPPAAGEGGAGLQDSVSGAMPGSASGLASGIASAAAIGGASGIAPGSVSAIAAGSASGTAPGSAAGTARGSASGIAAATPSSGAPRIATAAGSVAGTPLGNASGAAVPSAAALRARRAQLEQAVRYARALGVRQLSCPLPTGPDGAEQLAYAAALLRQHGLTLVAALRSAGGCGAAFAQMAALRSGGADNLYLQYRIDTGATVEGAAAVLAGRLPLIRHVRLRDAAAPEAEPWLALLDRLGYQGWVSCGAARLDLHHAGYPPPQHPPPQHHPPHEAEHVHQVHQAH